MASERFISGYAVVFNDETTIAGLWREKISPGAFDKSLRDRPDVLGLWSHDSARVLGRTTSKTLELKPDRAGLWFAMEPDEKSPDGATAWSAVERGDVSQCSFGFYVTRETWFDGGDHELPLRVIEEAGLIEISLVALPAYPSTSASVSGRSKDKEENNRNAQRRISWREREIANARIKMRARGITV